jgi:hypothetical protein
MISKLRRSYAATPGRRALTGLPIMFSALNRARVFGQPLEVTRLAGAIDDCRDIWPHAPQQRVHATGRIYPFHRNGPLVGLRLQ